MEYRLSLKPWGIALKFLFLHHENILAQSETLGDCVKILIFAS